MPGEGDVTVSPCFAVELRILLSSIFGKKNPLGFVIFGVSQSSRTKKSCSRGSTPHKVGEEKGKESNGDMANLARIENGD